jgi:cytochrome b6-f complex iron-sulfur subunit
VKNSDLPVLKVTHGVESRRDFLKKCGSTLGTVTLFGIVMPLIQSCEPASIPLVVEKTNGGGGIDGFTPVDVRQLTADNTALATSLTGTDGFSVIVSRLSATDYRAISRKCTHMGCQVEPPNGEVISCLCHGSQFHLDGTVLNGPAASPLRNYETRLDKISEGTLLVKL